MRDWWLGIGDLRLLGMRETSHRAEPYRLSHRSIPPASARHQQAEQEVNGRGPFPHRRALKGIAHPLLDGVNRVLTID